MSNIEEDIMSEEAFNELIDNLEIVETLTKYGRKAIKQNVKRLQKKIKKLEEENGILEFQNKQVENYVKELKKYNKTVSDRIVEHKKNSIPKQKIKDKIENLKSNLKFIACSKDCNKCFDKKGNVIYRGSSFMPCFAYHQIKILQEILKESEDK